jgi:hypothetical protein
LKLDCMLSSSSSLSAFRADMMQQVPGCEGQIVSETKASNHMYV